MLNMLQIILEIFSRVESVVVLCHCASVCKQWHELITVSNVVWRSIILRELNIVYINDNNRWLEIEKTKFDLASLTMYWRRIYLLR